MIMYAHHCMISGGNMIMYVHHCMISGGNT